MLEVKRIFLIHGLLLLTPTLVLAQDGRQADYKEAPDLSNYEEAASDNAWRGDDWADEVWDDDRWERDDRNDDDRWSKQAPRHARRTDSNIRVNGTFDLALGPIRASIVIRDGNLNRSIRSCQRQARRSRSWCRSRVLRRDRIRNMWTRVRWDRVFIDAPRNHHRKQRLSGRALRNTLDPWALDRIKRHGNRIGLRGNLRGWWEPAYGYGSRMEIQMDGVVVARIQDTDGDSWADAILLRR